MRSSTSTRGALLLAGFLVGAAACGTTDDGGGASGSSGSSGSPADASGEGAADDATPPGDAAVDASPLGCPDFAPQGPPVTVQAAVLTEASGLAASQKNPGILWSHNDAGNNSRVVAFRSDGSLVAVVKLTGTGSVDWEDVAIAPGTDGNDALFVADIGDNDEKRASVFVYRIAEPDLAAAVPTELAGATAIELVYDDGKPHNAEAMLVDPRDGSIVIITKVPTGVSEIYAAAPPFTAGPQHTLKKIGALTVGVDVSTSLLVTGASITRAGDLVLVRTYSSVLGFPRSPTQSLASALAAKPCPLPVAIEKQGEAVALSPDGSGFYTVSEGASPPLSFSKRR